MSRRQKPSGLRARTILERLSGSSDALDDLNELAEGSEALAERLTEIEQLFVLHGGKRRNQSVAPPADTPQLGPATGARADRRG